jgi:hypothetical protein
MCQPITYHFAPESLNKTLNRTCFGTPDCVNDQEQIHCKGAKKVRIPEIVVNIFQCQPQRHANSQAGACLAYYSRLAWQGGRSAVDSWLGLAARSFIIP